MIWATRLGDGWLWLTTGLFLTFGGSQYHRILAAVAVSAGITNILVVLLKRRFRRLRPGEYLPNRFLETCLSVDPFAFDRFSFPSGHSMNASAVATVLTLAFPPLGPLWAALAASIAVSRIVLGQPGRDQGSRGRRAPAWGRSWGQPPFISSWDERSSRPRRHREFTSRTRARHTRAPPWYPVTPRLDSLQGCTSPGGS